MASDPGNDPNPRQPIERIPFATIEKAYGIWVIRGWAWASVVITVIALVILITFLAVPDKLVFDIPQVLYTVGTLMVAAGISVLILGALTLEARAMVRDMATYGTGSTGAGGADGGGQFNINGGDGQQPGTVARGGSIAFTQIMDAATNLPTHRFLIIFGIVTMLLGAGLDGKWTMPNISFEVERAASTPVAGAGDDGAAPDDTTGTGDDGAADNATDDGNSPPPGDDDAGTEGTSGGDGP